MLEKIRLWCRSVRSPAGRGEPLVFSMEFERPVDPVEHREICEPQEPVLDCSNLNDRQNHRSDNTALLNAPAFRFLIRIQQTRSRYARVILVGLTVIYPAKPK